ncbi:DUF58 domain-containing protein [Taibaiella sp. KBW10]|uniref:DUF58 domain-containing protein n=1 Tax=Taibaiella sp. KBW10 TaxID=2153357 RepID=UPI000F5B5863|nr:DUF58 domain-containing protein [Taibaiella sp. KBW10]RQO29754.1 DUF58 domain-containing protein [Taibaiella sp. KBW10]
MTTAEILKKVRKIEIKTKGLSSHIFSGEYHSAFKGRGMSFSEVREYSPGDDVRTIDWNVTARFSTPFVKVFEEERELTVMLLVDVSGSSLFGTAQINKREMITEICAVLAFSANTNNDKVGVIFFSDKIEKYIPPKKGKSHILRIIRELITMQPAPNSGTDIRACLEFFNNVCRKKAISFLISDFIADAYDQPLKLAARRHDLVGLQIYDPLDVEMPSVGLLQVQDSETGHQQWIDTAHKSTRIHYTATFKKQQQYNADAFVRSGAQLLSVRTDQDYIKTLQSFFRARI